MKHEQQRKRQPDGRSTNRRTHMKELIDIIQNFSKAPIKSISYGCTAQEYLFFVRYRRNIQIHCMGSLEFLCVKSDSTQRDRSL
jgi:hypothetical protein